MTIFYEGNKEPVLLGDIYLQDSKHSEWARGEWEVLCIDIFPDSPRFARVTRRSLSTGRIDINGWNNTGKSLISRKPLNMGCEMVKVVGNPP